MRTTLLTDLLRRTSSHVDGQGDSAGQAAPRLLKVETVAALCEVSIRTVYRWLGPDGLPIYRFPGTGSRPILRIAQDDLDGFLARHRHDPEVEKAAAQRTLRLDGIRFMRQTSPDSRKPELDTRRPARPVCGPAERRSP